MIKVIQNQNLKSLHTFGVDVRCAAYATPANIEEIKFIAGYINDRNLDHIVLGEGSNLLFTSDYSGIVVRPVIQGIEIIDESSSEVLIKAGAGVNWDSFVAYCVSKGWYGPENLSLIPGTVGSAPVQNIGAYGREIESLVEEVEAIKLEDGSRVVFSANDCEFGYRSSYFKHAGRDRYLVTHVTFRLSKHGPLILDYGNVHEEFSKTTGQDLAALRETIIKIRREKLPDVDAWGNAGSYFKNPVVPEPVYQQLSQQYDNLPGFPTGSGVKIPAAWLIDRCGLKGHRTGNVGTWPKQPLVIVNYGGATGKEIFEFSEMIRHTVMDKFGVSLEREVLVIGN